MRATLTDWEDGSRRLLRGTVAGAPFLGATTAVAQDAASDALTQANNPLANSTAVNIQNYYIGELTDIDRAANTTYLRFAKPLSGFGGTWLTRTSLPISRVPVGPDDEEFGIGDLSAFATYLIDTRNPAISFGFGPQIVLPTASDDALGAGKWQLGLANVLFNASSKVFQWGYLLTWQASVAGDDDRADVNLGAFQPFGILQLGDGWYARSTGIWTYDFETDNRAIPLGMGVGRVIPTERIVYNAFVEPQYSIETRGPGQPQWQIFAGLNLQFR